MNQPLSPLNWWELHQRKARGEALSEPEERFYEAELARQDQEASPLRSDLTELKKMREQMQSLARENALLRDRVSELERDIRAVEQALSRETRQMLGRKMATAIRLLDQTDHQTGCGDCGAYHGR